jgi:hypothetical protein
MWKIQSDTPDKWYIAEQWQIKMIDAITKRNNKKFYAKHKHKNAIYTYVCIHDAIPGNIVLWNLTTNTIRYVIHSDYGERDHNGPVPGGGMCIDHLVMANELKSLPMV